MASGYLALTSRYCRISAVALESRFAPGPVAGGADSVYSLAAGAGRFLAAGFAAGALARPAFRRLMRAFNFF